MIEAVHKHTLPPLLFSGAVLAALCWGYLQKEEYHYSAESGVGYIFGIIGLALMGLLLLYPLRKHWKPLSGLLPVRYWFRMHMIFGIAGPVLILFHANFQHGSLNSTVALYSMLLVALSGLIGRYVYRQLHRGLYGETIRYQDLLNDYLTEIKNTGLPEDELLRSLRKKLDIESNSLFRLYRNFYQLKKTLKLPRDNNYRRITSQLIRMNRLLLFNRLFSLWHVFHMPVFLMMLLTAVAHVIVVHMY